MQLQPHGHNATAGSITPIIEPAGGHGDDDIEELGGHYVMVQGKFEPTDADATQVNDFRRVGIVKNPTDTATNNTATITTARTTNAILMNLVVLVLLLLMKKLHNQSTGVKVE